MDQMDILNIFRVNRQENNVNNHCESATLNRQPEHQMKMSVVRQTLCRQPEEISKPTRVCVRVCVFKLCMLKKALRRKSEHLGLMVQCAGRMVFRLSYLVQNVLTANNIVQLYVLV